MPLSEPGAAGGPVNIADLVGGANLDLLVKNTLGIWSGTAGLLTWRASARQLRIDAAGVTTGFAHLQYLNLDDQALVIDMSPDGADQKYFALRMQDGAGAGFDLIHDFSAPLVADGLLQIRTLSAGVIFEWKQDGTIFNALNANGPALRNVAASGIVPTLVPDRAQLTIGIGSAGPGILDLIADSLNVGSYTNTAGQVLRRDPIRTGITASTTQTQGNGPLTSTLNEIAIVANTDDTVTAPSVVPGLRLIIINNGANQLQVFPAAGDDIGAGVDASITIASGSVGRFVGRSIVAWDTLFNAAPSGGAAVANDAVQARRTTSFTLSTAFVDVTLDATDVETDPAVIEHDAITDRIVAKVAGTYEISYSFSTETVTILTSSIDVEGRVRLNDAGTGIAGSDSLNGADRDGGGSAANHPSQTCRTFIVGLAANDFVTLQLNKTDKVLTEAYTAEDIILTVKRLV